MHAIRGVYDGKTIRAIQNEELPVVEGEVPVQIIFLESDFLGSDTKEQRLSLIQRILSERDQRNPLSFPVRELIEDGRRY